MNEGTLLSRLEAGLRAGGAQGRKRVTSEAFDVFIAEATRGYLMSFAVPRGPEPEAWGPALEALKGAFAAHGRRPRLEFFHELRPGLAAALEEAGFARDSSAPVMVLTGAALAAPPPEPQGRPHGRYVRLSHRRPEQAEVFLRRQSLAYGGPSDEGALDWLPFLLQGLEAGKALAAGLALEGELVSGASIVLGGNVGELAGVWTLPERQGRGLAYELCARLLDDFFAAGHELAWLSAAEGAQGLYERLGFRRLGTQLNYGLPQTD